MVLWLLWKFQEHLMHLNFFCFAYLFISGFLLCFMCTLMYMEQKYSAASLCSITTEVLKVLNATEELLGEAEGKDPSPAGTPMSSGPGTRKLDQHLTKMEENVRFIIRICSNGFCSFVCSFVCFWRGEIQDHFFKTNRNCDQWNHTIECNF